MAQASKDFLWYKRKDQIKEEDLKHVPKWEKEGFILSNSQESQDDIIEIEKPEDESLVERIKDFAEDILDDGKRNRSNKKKSVKKK